MKTEKIYTSSEILGLDDLYNLQDSFCCCGINFKYQMTEGEFLWYRDWINGKYSIGDWITERIDENRILLFDDPIELGRVLVEDGIENKAVMLSDETALQKLFFWLACSD